jgi:hypothetical protein
MNTKLKAAVNKEHTVVCSSEQVCTGSDYTISNPLSSEFIASTTLEAFNDTDMAEHAGTRVKVETGEIVLSPKENQSPVKTAGMFAAAPFIALAFVIALPFIGFYNIAKLAFEAYARKRPAIAAKLKNIGLFFASPFIALGYVMALPFVGFYMFSKLAVEAHAKRG